MGPCEPRLVDFVGFLMISLTPLDAKILNPILLQESQGRILGGHREASIILLSSVESEIETTERG